VLAEELKSKLEALPTQSGVYVMKDKAGEVVYVGKAVSLRSRVLQYFQPASGDTRAFIPFLEDLLGDVEVLITPSEKDAVLLENELIKKHRPRFNIKLRDDKNFISLRLSTTHPFPRLEVVRRIRKDGARYFGPYASASSIRETLGIVNRHFQLRTCTDQVMANRRRPCLQYQIKRCPAPCVYNVPQEEYRRSVEEVSLFLEGKADELTAQLERRMGDASDKLEYERAAQLRDQLQAIERSLEKQRTVLGDLLDQDVLGFHREGPALEVHLLFFRSGRLTGGRSFSFNKQEFPTEELLSSFLDQYYESGAFIPKELLLPLELPDAQMREVWLGEKKGERVRVHVPERGEKVRLVEMAIANARHNFEERARSKADQLEALTRLQSRLRLPRLPRRIECFDISTFQGQLSVGSQVVFSDGEPDKSGYRLFKVRGEAAGDDFASMFQVLTRRLRRGIEEQNLPDLLVVDGGKGQLNVARAALRELGLSVKDVPLAGLAKSRVLEDEERFAARQGYRPAEAWPEKSAPLQEVAPQPHPVGIVANGSDTPPAAGRSRKKGRFVRADLERSPERVFLPGQKNPIVLRQNTSELHLLARLRDEAHRFAITFHRKLRRERNFKSVLEEIPGIGDRRKRALLSHFGSLKRIRAATAEDIAQVEGFNAQLAKRVHHFFVTGTKAAEAEAQEAAQGGADLDGGAPPEAGPGGGALLSERDDVAFDAAAAELEALEEDEASLLAEEEVETERAGGVASPAMQSARTSGAAAGGGAPQKKE
jgi:excinuclease ABC subunit C